MGPVRAVRVLGRSPSPRIALTATETLVDDDRLLPGERALVEGAPAARRAEFATGRHCAHLALASLTADAARGPAPDVASAPVLQDGRGAPQWPVGVVGSITHCAGWSGAVVARSGGGIRSLGLDAEPLAPLPAGVLDVVASRAEQAAVTRLGRERPGIPWDTVLFVAKEATYKAWYPLSGLVVGHDAVAVELSATGRFTGQVGGRRARGRWRVGPRVVLALAVVG